MRTASSIDLKRETDFFRRSNNKLISKQKKIKTIKITFFHVLFLIALVTLIALTIYKAGHFMLTWEKLDIQSYQLVNSPKRRPARLKALLGNNRGNILRLSFENLRSQLLTIPEVKEVYLNRILPDKVRIEFMLREPMFKIRENGVYHIIDHEGVVLYKTKDPGTDGDLITIRNVVPGKHEKIVPYLPQLEQIKARLEYVSMEVPYGIRIKLKGITETFYPGEIDFADKINYYLRLRKKLYVDHNKIRNVDLRFEDRFYLEFEEEVKQENEK
ncbi:MAG: FtsQ-type POTRA domain-containing protein [bacterium]|nr:FtsQ-type POTRA domain-containing protein [bacterium]